MHTDFHLAPWGMFYAAIMYVAGNAIWTNHIVRQRQWLGWLLWLLSAGIVVVAGALIEIRLSGEPAGLWETLTGVAPEKYWIIVSLYALLSFPGAASVIFRQGKTWTQLTVTASAMLIFIPLGHQLHDPDNARLAMSLGITLVTCAIMWMWVALLDSEPQHQRKTVPVEEMGT